LLGVSYVCIILTQYVWVGINFEHFFSQIHLGSMLWSQFSAIFDNFQQKNWRFSQKPMLWTKFCII
jgi:hypothetical protein